MCVCVSKQVGVRATAFVTESAAVGERKRVRVSACVCPHAVDHGAHALPDWIRCRCLPGRVWALLGPSQEGTGQRFTWRCLFGHQVREALAKGKSDISKGKVEEISSDTNHMQDHRDGNNTEKLIFLRFQSLFTLNISFVLNSDNRLAFTFCFWLILQRLSPLDALGLTDI